MLVIPALISLKSSVIEEKSSYIQTLVSETILLLRDPSEIVSKTARKLICELHKCYPNSFEENFISNLPSQTDRKVCSLLISNQVEEAQKLIEK
jgi:hypothetical protein